jgi:hypothetical protein
MSPQQMVQARERFNDEIGRNRRRLVDLMYSMGSFTEEDLVEAFREQYGRMSTIDVQRTLRDYLGELTRIGVLRYQGGRYTVS